MNIEATFTWERSPGEEIELRIGGEYREAERLTKYDQWSEESVFLDWIIDPTGKCECDKCKTLESGKYLSKLHFDKSEIDAMYDALMEAAHREINNPVNIAAKNLRSFGGLRNLLDLPNPEPFYG